MLQIVPEQRENLNHPDIPQKKGCRIKEMILNAAARFAVFILLF